jgi:prevent-host-death family protein
MPVVTIEDAQTKLFEIIHKLAPGEEVIITENNRPVAKLIAEVGEERKPRKAGTAKGRLIIHADDGEHLTDFGDYMQ